MNDWIGRNSWGISLALGLALLAGGLVLAQLLLVASGAFLLVAGALGPQLRRLKYGPGGIEADFWRDAAKELREIVGEGKVVSPGPVVNGEGVVITPDPVAVKVDVLEPRIVVGNAAAQIANALEQTPPETPKQLADELYEAIRSVVAEDRGTGRDEATLQANHTASDEGRGTDTATVERTDETS